VRHGLCCGFAIQTCATGGNARKWRRWLPTGRRTVSIITTTRLQHSILAAARPVFHQRVTTIAFRISYVQPPFPAGWRKRWRQEGYAGEKEEGSYRSIGTTNRCCHTQLRVCAALFTTYVPPDSPLRSATCHPHRTLPGTYTLQPLPFTTGAAAFAIEWKEDTDSSSLPLCKSTSALSIASLHTDPLLHANIT